MHPMHSGATKWGSAWHAAPFVSPAFVYRGVSVRPRVVPAHAKALHRCVHAPLVAVSLAPDARPGVSDTAKQAKGIA